MRISKKITALFIAVMMVVSAIPFTASAADEPYLTFTGTESFSIKTKKSTKNWDGTLEYSTDANTWTTWDGTQISSDNNVLYLRGKNNTQLTGITDTYRWVITTEGTVACSGDIRTLLDYDYPEYTEMGNSCFAYLFNSCTSLTAAPELPATILADNCYSCMFSGCTSLTTAPALPATTLERNCYYCMFGGCTNLTTAPKLPATTLASECYSYMFLNCTSLTTAPKLWATMLANSCYQSMFQGCASLTTAPALPATSLAEQCYRSMFQGCTSLTTPSKLPATDLTDSCYNSMFNGCTGIKLSTTQTAEYNTPYSIPKAGTGTMGSYSLNNMFNGTGGTFTGTPTINTTYYIPAPPAPTGVAEVNGDGYETLEEAIEAANEGDTVKLLADIDFSTTYTERNARDYGREHVIDLKDCTLDLDGHTISTINGTVEFSGNGATIQNGTFDLVPKNTDGSYKAGSYALIIDNSGDGNYGENGTVTVNNVVCNGAVNVKKATVALNNVTARTTPTKFYAVWAEDDANVTINSGTYTDTDGTNQGSGVLATGTSGDEVGATIEVKGGTFEATKKIVAGAETDSIKISGGSFSQVVPEKYCADGFEPVTTPDAQGKYTVEVDTHTVAKIGNQKFDSVAEAIAAAQDGDTITILADTTVDNTIVVNDGRNITIDTNGKTISSTNRVFEIRHGGVTLTGNGTVSTTAVSAVAVYGSTDITDADYATFTLGADTTISAPSGYGAMIGANNKAAYGAKLTLNGTIDSAYGVYVNGNIQEPADKTNAAQVTINGTVTADDENAAVYAAGYAKWAVNAGSTVSGGSGIYIKSGDLAVNGGAITANGTKTAYTFNTNGANGTGDAIIIDSCGYPGNVPTVAINAGTVTSANGDAVASYTKQDDPRYPEATFARVDEVIPATSTAVFSSDVSKLAEEGYVTVYDANEHGYVVEKDTSDSISITTADEIDVNLYLGETGEEATVEYTFNTTPDQQTNVQGTKTVDFDSLPEVAGKRKLTIRVAPAQIRDNITIVIKDAAGDKVRSYENASVAIYCNILIAGDYSENIKTLAKSVLDYGKAAANFFGYNESAFTNQADNFNSFTFDTTGWAAVADGITIEEVRYVATSVPSLRFKVDMTEADAERYTVETDKGYKAKFVKVGDDVILQVTGIPASKLGETITVSVKDAQEDVVATIQYTPIIYAYKASKANNAELARLGETIGQYSAAAKAVFA